MTDRSNPTTLSCPNCSTAAVDALRKERENFRYGTGSDAVTLAADVQIYRCRECSFEFTDESSSDARHTAVCRHLAVSTPREVLSVRERYGLSQEEFAAITRIGKASLNRWENGLLIQNPANDHYLYLLTFPENLERLKVRGKPQPSESKSTLGSRSNVIEFRPKFKLIAEAEQESIGKDFDLYVGSKRR